MDAPIFGNLTIASAGLLKKKKQFGQFFYPQVSNFQFSKTALIP